eukprot:TRINITY_DN16123_c0_g1_i1.p1 TRINITY_DN16123_c0_g1~~TRINITY_DN16123_c0_g1_i1.p1  ORF type:complete len:174 (+),score=17.45 TRINITY_DN16123_c0_g1_i1:196-717(+)
MSSSSRTPRLRTKSQLVGRKRASSVQSPRARQRQKFGDDYLDQSTTFGTHRTDVLFDAKSTPENRERLRSELDYALHYNQQLIQEYHKQIAYIEDKLDQSSSSSSRKPESKYSERIERRRNKVETLRSKKDRLQKAIGVARGRISELESAVPQRRGQRKVPVSSLADVEALKN